MAVQVLNKCLNTDKAINIIFIDSSRSSIDGRRIEQNQMPQNTLVKDFAQTFPLDQFDSLEPMPDQLMDELEAVIVKFPKPLISHVNKAMFHISMKYGRTDTKRGEFLGLSKRKYNRWRTKLDI